MGKFTTKLKLRMAKFARACSKSDSDFIKGFGEGILSNKEIELHANVLDEIEKEEVRKMIEQVK